uniref:NADH-ubiquinone oxidoreductase chain 6 n=1 Tax=Planusocoris schaeferi TaxID=2924051 RepID=A0A8T9EH53_9HEMI|nr:NADH dehydrogenase subunit 6 [Planusocoris schaeferi]UNA71171.1 NADH dehydrogenase subunit 6 [Planusocoris schaeferi]
MILFMMLVIMSIMFMTFKHPLSMGMGIITHTIIIAMISGMMLGSFWFSYIIMIIMLSGMLVLFIYMASVASNEKFHPSTKMIMMMLMMIIMSMIYQMYLEINDNEMETLINPEKLSLNSLFNMKHKNITMMMVIYLFFTMINVSFIVNISEGPLRIMKN